MPDRDPYGIPVVQPPPVVHVVKDPDRGPDPRRIVAETLTIVGKWGGIDYSDIVEDVMTANPTDVVCPLCNDEECDIGCPMTRWRGQS